MSVGEEGLEPSQIAPHGPKPCAYTNSATRPIESSALLRASYSMRVEISYNTAI